MSKEDKTPGPESINGDAKLLQELVDLMKDEGLGVLELKDEDRHIKLIRSGSSRRDIPLHLAAAPTAAPAGPAPEAAAPAEPPAGIVSPLAGVFYRASSPSTPPYVKEGDLVEAGQTLCIVEAMKVMNEIKADARCRIVKIAAENSRPVTAGQTLFVTEPA